MKGRKQKQSAPKKVTITSGEGFSSHFAYNNAKQVSGHTKISTNCTIHSSATGQAAIDRKHKNKKNGVSLGKQDTSEAARPLPTSKSTKKLRLLELPVKKEITFQAEREPSYREYCVVDENFIPITTNNEKKLLDHFLAQTASSSCDYNFFKNIDKAVAKDPYCAILRKRSISSEKESEREQSTKIQKEDKATSIYQKKKSLKAVEVLAVPESIEIGMQYSQRKSEIEVKIEEPVVQKLIEPVTLQQSQMDIGGESLSDLLLKLEFSHLGDDKSFNVLTSNQKEHFSQLLETLINKLKPKTIPIKRDIKAITFTYDDEDSINQSYSSEPFQKMDECIKSLAIDTRLINYQNLQKLVFLRQFMQNSDIEDPIQFDSQKNVNTSMFSVINFLCHLFCFIEVEYADEFIDMIRKRYGFTFKDKYRRITRRLPLIHDNRFKVVHDEVFTDFIEENNSGVYNAYQIAHLRSVFDAFNEHLQQYRPFYPSNGEQFPWVFKVFITMSEYSIDEDSLHIIFRQAKQKMVDWLGTLCGIHVNHQQKVMLPDNPLEMKRIQKENKLILTWLSQQNFEKDGIELYSTQTLHDVSIWIYQDLVIEFLREASLANFI